MNTWNSGRDFTATYRPTRRAVLEAALTAAIVGAAAGGARAQDKAKQGVFPGTVVIPERGRASKEGRLPSGLGARQATGGGGFRQTHGQTLGEYVRRLRIEVACRRLTATDLAITEIAVECGFSDHSHFARVFRRHMGVSPGRSRQAHRS